MAIRAVIFDYGGVLCFPPSAAQIEGAARRCRLSSEGFLRAFWSIRIRYDAGEFSPHEYWREVAAIAGRSFDDRLIAEMIEAEIDFWSRLDDRVLAWNDALRAAGFKTAMLSNLPAPLGNRLREQGFYDRFDRATLSFEIGAVKPSHRIYEDALRGLGIAAADALFLDDRKENVDGALALGIHAEPYNSWDDLAAIVKRYELPAHDAFARRQ